ncbi:sulfite exporter TauE/SafE family protein [Saprospira sp. CCB-QB6]|uniref:sulfite exporter TauE/SafE family protein n=1 Tax=Saprospira sp. CCB-QB6 TaxID=3023936 RepID=UPI00234A0BC8|nr:sulfite exporter TauE/SafE family protein [Saprospira sp. CCB-QB6]WCL81873.1 sulfite exporter TauE/SafE family protein [Saprospira sp. CCB-QB6]
MPDDIYLYLLAAFGSLLAGFINTLAGSGSVITLSILMYVVGLPAKIASATIRFSILAMLGFTLPHYQRAGKIDWKRDWLMVASTAVGGIFGIFLLIYVDNAVFKDSMKYVFLALLFVVLFDSKRWLKETDPSALSPWIVVPLFFVVGLYGGFIQMGVGLLFLVVTVLGAGYNIIDAGGIKLAAIASYTIFAVLLFAYSGLIRWDFALAMSVGEIAGGQLGAHFAVKHPKAGLWAHRMLVVLLISVVVRAFFF